MSEYVDIKIGKMSLWTFRNHLDKNIVGALFSKIDLKVEEIDKGLNSYFYQTIVKKSKERLDALGYGINCLKDKFEDKATIPVDYCEYLGHLNVDLDDFESVAKERFEKKITFKKWTNALKKIVEYEYENGNINLSNTCNIPLKTECEKLIYYSSMSENNNSFFAINCEIISEIYVMRMILECFNDEDVITLNFSDLAYWSDDSISEGLVATENIEKTIVLVEGETDKKILEFAIDHLYPHLEDLFYFMAFNEGNVKRDGGSSFICKNLKVFYFSKLKSKFIAIFVNDAEGLKSKSSLLNEIKNWPNNFKIMLYPELNEFNKYPTIMPNGRNIRDNINKKACSIELYLPNEIITNSEKKFYPIEWESRKSFKSATGENVSLYQGVISNKAKIQKKFEDYQKNVKNGNKTFIKEDWEKMRILLESLVYAFKN